MSGHSKWSTIKRKKGATDAKRGALFTKLIREITVSAREGGSNIDGNFRLRTAVDKAQQHNMPQDNITRAVKKGTGELEGVSYNESILEGYGPGGAALLLQILTDNKNRTISEVRHILSKNHGNMGEAGCVAWVFKKRGLLQFSHSKISEDDLMEAAIEAGAEDVVDGGDAWEVYTDPTQLEVVRAALETKNLKPDNVELTMQPENTVELEAKDAEQILKLMDALEENDDVQNVYANFDIAPEVMESLANT
jgi:YebC/PmpR family DNA-binding regulatory protein